VKIISSRTHTYIGLLVGVVLIVAPWLIGFDDVEASTWTAVGVGLFIVLNELMTTSPASPMKLVPMRVHLAVDVVTGIALAVSPWLFGFADEDTNVWLPHVVVGVLVAGYALLTDPRDAVRPAGTAGLPTAADQHGQRERR